MCRPDDKIVGSEPEIVGFESSDREEPEEEEEYQAGSFVRYYNQKYGLDVAEVASSNEQCSLSGYFCS